MCNGLSGRVLAHKGTGQCDVKYTQYELILASLSDEQVLIDTDRRHREKVQVHCLPDSSFNFFTISSLHSH